VAVLTTFRSAHAPFELYTLTRLKRPKHIVEVGVSAGVSSAYLLRALQSKGVGILHSIDLPEREADSKSPSVRQRGSWALPHGKFPGWGVPQYLRRNWDLRIGKSGDVFPSLIKEINRVDIFLYDVPYEIDEAIEDFKIVDRKLRDGSVVLADNCLVPITWWAKKRRAKLYNRKGSGLGFHV